MMYFGLGIGWWIVTGLGMLISMIASWRVKSAFRKFARVGLRNGMTGTDAAHAVMRARGIHDVRVEPSRGFLSDHYDPRHRTLRLSPDVYNGRSISAVAVAAHEAGHAIQHADGYGPLVLRSKLVPISSIGSRLWVFLAGAGFLLGITGLAYVGIALFAAVVLFQLVTLPTEFDASNRAKKILVEAGIVQTPEEEAGVAKVLNAAAMTYVAAALTAIMQLLYLILRARSQD